MQRSSTQQQRCHFLYPLPRTFPRTPTSDHHAGPARRMRRTRPLQYHPELLIVDTPKLCREYRVENWRILRDGTGRTRRGADGLTWVDALLVLGAAILWPLVRIAPLYAVRANLVEQAYPHRLATAALVVALGMYFYAKCTQILWGAYILARTLCVPKHFAESVVAFPAMGIQLETHRGFPPIVFAVSRTFIPLSVMHDVLVNEALRRWDVHFYLAVLSNSESGMPHLGVAFPVCLICGTVWRALTALHDRISFHGSPSCDTFTVISGSIWAWIMRRRLNRPLFTYLYHTAIEPQAPDLLACTCKRTRNAPTR